MQGGPGGALMAPSAISSAVRLMFLVDCFRFFVILCRFERFGICNVLAFGNAYLICIGIYTGTWVCYNIIVVHLTNLKECFQCVI